MTQLAFDLPVRVATGRGDFFVSPANAPAIAALERWPEWPGGRLAIIGPESAGKSHLVAVWVGLSGALVLDGAALREDDVPDVAARSCIAIEGADAAREAALLHLINAHAERSGSLLLTARHAPAHWGTALPDLASRLASIPVARLLPPDDGLLRALLLKHFADRQILAPPELVSWLLSRMDRSAAAAEATVRALDALALSAGRPVSLRLAQKSLRL